MKDIMLKITGTQIGLDSEEQQMEFITEGKLYERGGALYLVYDESDISGEAGCRTTLKYTENKVRLRRFGKHLGRQTVLEFEKGKRYNGLYTMEFGSLPMEILTNSLEGNISESGKGRIDIDYNISLRGLLEGRNKINIEIM